MYLVELENARFLAANLGILKRRIAVGFMCVAIVTALAPSLQSRPYQGDGAKAEQIDWSVFLPDGEGRSAVTLSCTSCHDLRQVITQRKTESGWRTSVQKMVSMYKAPIDKEDVPVLTQYLSRHFGKTNPIERLPMDINSSSVECLARLPGISADVAKAIVEARDRKGRFESVEDLLRINGIEEPVLKRIKPYIMVAHQ